MTRVVYLHGFASTAQSSKATFFAAKLAARGVTLETPDLNEPDFATLTVSRMIAQVGEIVDHGPAEAGHHRDQAGEPVALIGSSLGAFVAVQVALRHPATVRRLVLLAPALDFGGDRLRAPGGGALEDWKAAGSLDVFHYGYGRLVPVHYELYADASRYDGLHAQLTLPIQVFQGRRDTAVDPKTVEQWSKARPNVELHMLDDEHQLRESLDDIWREMEPFLELSVVSGQ